jgi:hypothetical protein
MVKMVKELAKLGVFKSKSKKRAKSAVGDAIRQDSDMVGYTKTLGGPQMRNLPPIQQIQPGMSQSQIDDIQRRNDAVVAALRGEVQQQRLEDIEAQQGQRFADITKLGGIMNPLLERFRGSTFPAQAMGDQPIDPFSTRRPGAVPLGDIPDIQETRFTETLNEGGPGAEEKRQTVSLAEEEEEEEEEEENVPGISIEQVSEEPLTGGGSSQGPIIRKKTRNELLSERNLGRLPPVKNTITEDMRDYYIDFAQEFGVEVKRNILNNKKLMYKEMVKIIDEEVPIS